jgi:hypothetical protein
MIRIARHLFALGLIVALAGSASAQTRTGGQTGQNGGGLGGGQGQGGGGDGVGLVGETVGISQQQMTTVRNNVTQTSNVLGGYYGNFMYQGQIGSTGATSPGGFGQVMYSTGTTGGMTGAGGMTTGNRAGGTGFGNTGFGNTGSAGGRSGSTGTTGFGGATTTGFGNTGAGGGRAGGTTGFGGGTTGLGGGLTGGRGGQLGGQFGGAGGRGATGGMGATNPYTITGDRAVNAYYRPSGVFPTSGPPLVELAQTELRGIFDRSLALPDGKTINVSVATDGVAVLKGTVANDDEKRLAIGLAAITPGVRRVNSSELVVQQKP